MNTLYYILVLTISCLYNAHAADFVPNPVTDAIQAATSYIQSRHPTGTYIPLEEYNTHPYYTDNRINITSVKTFLDEQLRRRCLNPEQFDYLVGTADQDWQIIKLTNSFGLIIPDPSTQVGALGTQLRNLLTLHRGNEPITPAQPTYTLNVKQLSDLLDQPPSNTQKHELAKYTLAIVKAVVQAENKNILTDPISICYAAASGMVIGHAPSSLLSYTLTALSSLYSYIQGNDDWVALQKHLDEYIIRSNDKELMLAHIEDLENQLAQNESSYIARFSSYIPMIAQSPLKERLLLFKNYYRQMIARSLHN